MPRHLLLLLPLLLGCPAAVEPGTEPTVTSLPPSGFVDPFACVGRPEPVACEAEQIDGAVCTVTLRNATGVTIESIGLRRGCAYDGVDFDGYPASPVYPVITGGELLDGATITQQVVAGPYSVSAGQTSDDFISLGWGGMDFVCEDGEDIEVVIDNDTLFDGVLTVLNDRAGALVDVRTATASNLDWSDNLLTSAIPPGGLAHFDPPDGVGYVRAVDAGGNVSWRSFRVVASSGTCFFARPPDQLDFVSAGEPCRWTVDNFTGLDAFSPSVSDGDCEGDGLRLLPWPHQVDAGATFELYAPPGEWALHLWNEAARYEIHGLSCEPGGTERIEVGEDHRQLDDPCE